MPDQSENTTFQFVSSQVTALGGPFLTAQDQPPAPGAGPLARFWHSLRKIAGRGLDAIPKHPTVPWLALRLAAVLALWVLILGIVLEVLTFWALFVLPFQLLFGRRRRPEVQPQQVVMAAASAPVVSPADLLHRQLDAAPDPEPESAVDRCPSCGAGAVAAGATCAYCRGRLPQVTRRGWHPDPLRHADRRWFDGARWSEQTR